MYKQLIALDPEGKKGTTEYGRAKDKVSYTQLAEYNVANGSLTARPPDTGGMLAFVKKYPDSQIVKDGYAGLSRFFGRQGTKEDATKFFEGYTARFPQEGQAVSGWVTRILFDKEPVDKGIELAQKAIALGGGRSAVMGYQNLARLYLLKGDKAKAVEAADQLVKAAAPMTPPAGAPAGAVPATPMAGMAPEPLAAQIYVDAGKMDKALAIYGPDFAAKNSKIGPLLSRYVQFWAGQGTNLDSALAAAKTVVALTPDAYSAHSSLANVLEKMKNYPEALKAAEKALSLAPANPPQAKASIQKMIDNIKAATEKK